MTRPRSVWARLLKNPITGIGDIEERGNKCGSVIHESTANNTRWNARPHAVFGAGKSNASVEFAHQRAPAPAPWQPDVCCIFTVNGKFPVGVPGAAGQPGASGD